MDTNINRVYVNPNFSRVSSRTIHTSDPTYSNNHFYINPNFTRNTTDVEQFTNLNRKIYVNPNFIKTTNSLERTEGSKSQLEINNSASLIYSSSTINRHSSFNQCKIKKPSICDNTLARPSSESKYRLVRKNDIENINMLETQRQGRKESCTIKINKYKSIPFHNYKNNLQIVRNETINQIPFKSSTNPLIPQYVNRNLKLVRHNLKLTTNILPKVTLKAQKIKRNVELKFQPKLKVLNCNRKKNNIPCRLFTKYGKCLRNLYGTCEYSHDRKHVSMCRKFIKGICHDKHCLLSHELSSKKMPTCFFYLKGMCTKEDCPYLHVKLNEKSKVCLDFLKGYCDKGEMCLHRHVRKQTDRNDKKCYTLNKSTLNRSMKLNTSKLIKSKQLRKLAESRSIKPNLENNCHNDVADDGECRYFTDLQKRETMCEVLKPTRCKLGILPAFIRL